MFYGYVYLITNKINNHKYVGMRASPVFDESYWGSGILIQRAIKKYGKDNFTREILHWCKDYNDLIMTEVTELQSRNAANSDEYYNIIDTATPILFGENNGFYGKKHNEKTKKLISDKNTGSIWTDEQHENYKKWVNSEDGIEVRNMLSQLKKGIPLTEDHKLAISNSFTEERCKEISRKRKEFFLTEDGKILKEKFSMLASERFRGIEKTQEHKNNISIALTGKTHYWQDKVNKNPEKIRKTAEKHTGMKRSDIAKKNMSDAKKEKVAHNKGKKYFYNPAKPDEKILCELADAPKGWINGIYKKSKV
jgi:hypothetical protein